METLHQDRNVKESENKDWNSYFDELEDSYFKEFYKNNSKERSYLQRKVDGKDLESFASRKFILVDIWKCLYIEAYLKKFGVKREVFESEVLDYEKSPEKSDEYKLNKYALKHIEVSIDAITDEGEKKIP